MRRDAPWSPCRYSAAGREGAPQSAEAVTVPMASLGGLHSLLVWLLLLQPWLTEASENGSATPLPPPAPSGGGMKNRTAVQPPPGGTSEVPKLAEFSLGDSALGVRRGGLRRQGGSCCSPGAWEDWGLNERSHPGVGVGGCASCADPRPADLEALPWSLGGRGLLGCLGGSRESGPVSQRFSLPPCPHPSVRPSVPENLGRTGQRGREMALASEPEGP